MSAPRLALLLCLLLPFSGLAQAPAPPEELPPPVTLPPLIPAPAEPLEPPDSDAPSKGTPQGELISREWRAERDSSPAVPRILLEVLGGTLGGTLGILPGGLLLVSGLCFEVCDDGAESRAILGLALSLAGIVGGTAVGIVGAGSLLQGQGSYWPTAGGVATGLLAGVLVGIAVASSAEEAALIPAIVGPLLGGIIGYEISHSSAFERRYLSQASGTRVVPVVSILPRGGVLGGLAGRF
jgi:hypothetical protein